MKRSPSGNSSWAAVVALDFLPLGQSVLESAFDRFLDHIGTLLTAADDPNRKNVELRFLGEDDVT